MVPAGFVNGSQRIHTKQTVHHLQDVASTRAMSVWRLRHGRYPNQSRILECSQRHQQSLQHTRDCCCERALLRPVLLCNHVHCLLGTCQPLLCARPQGKNFCLVHTGERKCQSAKCKKLARGMTPFCLAHGGGQPCQFEGCSKTAAGNATLCATHGGRRQCQRGGCSKSAQVLIPVVARRSKLRE